MIIAEKEVDNAGHVVIVDATVSRDATKFIAKGYKIIGMGRINKEGSLMLLKKTQNSGYSISDVEDWLKKAIKVEKLKLDKSTGCIYYNM